MLEFDGEEWFDQPRDVVFDRLVDMNFMSRVIPDLDRAEVPEPGRLVCRVRPGFSFLRGKLDLVFVILEQGRPETIRYQSSAKGIGASVQVEVALALIDDGGNATKVQWKAKADQMTGLIKQISRGLLEAAAKKVIGDVWASFGRELA